MTKNTTEHNIHQIGIGNGTEVANGSRIICFFVFEMLLFFLFCFVREGREGMREGRRGAGERRRQN